VQAKAFHEQSDVYGTLDEMIDFERSSQFDGFNPVKAAKWHSGMESSAASAEGTRLDPTLQVGGVVRRYFGEKAIVGMVE
jgi:hypothetical protein